MEKQTITLKKSAIIGDKKTHDAWIIYSSVGTFVCEKDDRIKLDDDSPQFTFTMKPKR